jgi:hypothetical protein
VLFLGGAVEFVLTVDPRDGLRTQQDPTTAPIAKGNTKPPYNGQAVTWELIQLA